MLYTVEDNGLSLLTIDTADINYDKLSKNLGLKTDLEKISLKCVVDFFDNTDPDLRNGYYKTKSELIREARETLVDKLIEKEILQRNVRSITGIQQAVYGLNPKKLLKLSQ